MTFTRHHTYSLEPDGQMSRRHGELPSVIRLAPVRVTITDGTGHRLAARLLRRLADEIEREGEATP